MRMLFHTASDGKLGGAWERGYQECVCLRNFRIVVQDMVVLPTSHVIIFSLADDFEIKWWQNLLLVIGALAVVPGIVLIITGIVVYCCRNSELYAWLSVSTVQYNL